MEAQAMRHRDDLALRFVLTIVVTLMCFGCSHEALPIAPSVLQTASEPGSRLPNPTSHIWLLVIEASGSGRCVADAKVEIVRGQGVGRSVTQGVCSYWDPDFDAAFNMLTPGEELTLRASAPGYAAKEVTLVPRWGTQEVLFELSRIR